MYWSTIIITDLLTYMNWVKPREDYFRMHVGYAQTNTRGEKLCYVEYRTNTEPYNPTRTLQAYRFNPLRPKIAA